VGVRLLAVLLAFSCVLSLVASYYDYRTEQTSARDSLLATGRSLARLAALACPELVTVFDTPTLEDICDDLVLGERCVAYAAVIRADGKQLACNPRFGIPNDPMTVEIREPIRIERDGEKIGTFVVGLSLRPMQKALRAKTTGLLLRASIGFLLVAMLFWIALRAFVLVPLRRLDGVAQRLGHGELEEPIPALGATELGRLGATMDVMRTNLLANQQRLATQNQQLLELNRLKTQFLANVSHEMRTPLTSILGGVEALVGDQVSSDERLVAADSMQRNGEMLLDLVNGVLDLAKLESGSLIIDLGTCRADLVVADVCRRYSADALCKGLLMRCNADSGALQPVTTDAARLRQVVSALVGNAVKFTESGSIDVRTSLEEVGDGLLLRVEVQDTGIGIAAEFVPHLFESFSQADGSLTRRHVGSGLGLAIAHRLTQLLGGRIEVTSEIGRGTCVVATFAVERVAAAAPQPAPVVVPAPSLQGKVLVVDDAPDNQRLLRAIMTKAGLQVDLADNGRLGVEAVQRAQSKPYSLVIMDLQMPVLDGISAIRELREQGYTVPIVALTAHAVAEDRERCMAAGATQYETKPITRKHLLEVVAAHIVRTTG
jgi:signal transduction histidine kinase/ActR/RegA family two-component response regulator